MERVKCQGGLYIVATPIGNLSDITHRALDILAGVELIAAEDTRQTRKLLDHYGIRAQLVALHDHNEAQQAGQLLDRIGMGAAVALVSDAGTPLISDPGYVLVAAAHERGLPVIPIPGPSAMLAALCVSGLPCDRFVFEGFLPAKAQARSECLERVKAETRTLVFYESPHRIMDTLAAMSAVFPGRRMTLARELTKRFETVRRDTVQAIQQWLLMDSDQRKGEFVLVLEGAQKNDLVDHQQARVYLTRLLQELPPKKAVNVVADLLDGVDKRQLYEYALSLRTE